MVARLRRRTSAAATWSRRLAVLALAVLLVAGISHRFDLLGTIEFFWVLGVVVAMGFLALVLSILGFTRLWEHGDRAGRASLAGLLVSLVVLAPFAYASVLAINNPRLNDISTDVVDPPDLVAARRIRTADMNPIAPISESDGALQVEHYPQVTGRRYAATAERTVEGVTAAAAEVGWQVVDMPVWQDETDSVTIGIVAGSAIFGFPSDVAVRVMDEGETSYVDARSVSRYGLHDLGSNAGRLERFLLTLDRIMAGAAGM